MNFYFVTVQDHFEKGTPWGLLWKKEGRDDLLTRHPWEGARSGLCSFEGLEGTNLVGVTAICIPNLLDF